MNQISIGMNARMFPNNWRPALQEIAFAQAQGFAALQFSTRDKPIDEGMVGDPFAVVGRALASAGLMPTMEIMVHLDVPDPTPMEVLQANLPAILGLGCRCVHWHPVAHTVIHEPATVAQLERELLLHLSRAVELAAHHGFKFGLEHNEGGYPIFCKPEVCRATLDAVPGLHFVWDLNHTAPDELAAFKQLIPRMSLLHMSDTPLPEVNHHLPLGWAISTLPITAAPCLMGALTAPPFSRSAACPNLAATAAIPMRL